MTRGADIIAAIILLALAIAIIVYLLHWLYRRSSKEVSFVRTGMLGEKVVISGGAFVLPIIHNITQVGMRTLSITVKRGGDKIELAKKEFELLLLLASSPDKLFRRDEIYSKVWGADQLFGDRTIDVHIRKIRKKIGDNYISTVKGLGYRIAV